MPGLRFDIGDYNRPVQIEADAKDRGETPKMDEVYRQPQPDFKAVANRWARIQPLNATETLRAMQTTATTTHQINLRYFAGLTTRHRLRMGRRVFNIDGLTDLGDVHWEHELRCTEVELKPGQQV